MARVKLLRGIWGLVLVASIGLTTRTAVYGATDAEDACAYPRLIVSTRAPAEVTDGTRHWGAEKVLAYDILMRSATKNQWSREELYDLASAVGDAHLKLLRTFPETAIVPRTDYLDRRLEVEFTAAFASLLQSHVKGGADAGTTPESISPGLAALARELCTCWITVEPGSASKYTFVYFQDTVNLKYALRRIRELPEVQSASFARLSDYASPKYRPGPNISARADGDQFHFTLITADSSGLLEKRHFLVKGDEVREVVADHSLTAADLEPVPLPPDVWRRADDRVPCRQR